MDCPLCKANMEEGTTILPFDMKNGRVIVVLNVPARICEQCGEEFVDMAVVRNVEALLERAERDGLSMGFLEYGLPPLKVEAIRVICYQLMVICASFFVPRSSF
ncbi:MAG: type II toxin-antitoxin system MqsA family antitoxin [Desulfovermiculus sp.]|nr:type II toxin-antitoxin system MqsA family antitoxin [Desulfovermiculus sp.]